MKRSDDPGSRYNPAVPAPPPVPDSRPDLDTPPDPPPVTRPRPTVAVDLRALVPEATGIGVYTHQLLSALTDLPDAPRFVGMAHTEPRGSGPLRDAGVEIDVQRVPLGAWLQQRLPLGVWWQQRVLPKRLGRGDVDLLFSPLQTLPVMRPACPVPTVVTVHDLTVVLRPDEHRFKVRWSQLPFLERSMDRAGRIIADSRSTADDLLSQFPDASRGKVEVIHLGVGPEYRPADAETVAEIRRELGAPEGYLLFVGTLEPRKNLPTLLNAWEVLRDADPDFPPLLLAGGTGWHSDKVQRRIERLTGHGVRHLGRPSDAELVRAYQGATAFAYPSLYEGFGLPVLEAMACGVPCVTADVSSLPEVVGDAGLLVNPRDVAELAAALQRLIGEPTLAADLAARGRERARRFTWERAARLHAEVFSQALADGRAPTPDASTPDDAKSKVD